MKLTYVIISLIGFFIPFVGVGGSFFLLNGDRDDKEAAKVVLMIVFVSLILNFLNIWRCLIL